MMNRLLKAVVVAAALTILSAAQAVEFTTQSFHVDAVINRDRSVDFTETIAVTFTAPQHGILREIPIRTAGSAGIRIIGLNVDGVMEAKPHETFRPIQYDQSGDSDLRIKIGDPSQLVTGPMIYRISYRVTDGLTDQPQSTELYWNMIPAHWPTAIEQASFVVNFPPTGWAKTQLFMGDAGSTASLSGSNPVQGSSIKTASYGWSSASPLNEGEGMTLVLAVPLGTVAAPPPGTNGAVIIPGHKDGYFWVPFLIPIVGFFVWLPRMRFPGRPITASAQVPTGIDVLEADLILHERFTSEGFVGGIVALAQAGLAKLEHRPDGRGFSVELLPNNRLLNPNRRPIDYLYSYLGGFPSPVTSDALARQGLQEMFSGIGAGLKPKGLVIGTTYRFRMLNAFPILLLGFFAALFIAGGWLQSVVTFFTIFLSVAAACWIRSFATNLTPDGQAVRDQIEGLRLFISDSHHYALPARFDQKMFDEFLPYAIMFGLASEWSSAFGRVNLQIPAWYGGCSNNYWADDFWNDHSSFNDGVGSDFVAGTSSYGSGGGWSSGGSGFDSGGGGSDGGGSSDSGGGGGGGDSW